MSEIAEFNDFNDFFNWYIAIIKSLVPDPDKTDYRIVLDRIPKLTKEEKDELESKIIEFQPLPPGIVLVNDDSAFTLFSRYNPALKRVEICYPSILRYWVRFPLLIKAGIQHEFGHIINGDIYVPVTEAHAQCSNICMDIRINQNINREAINQINCCLFYFVNAQHPANTPEGRFGELGIPLSLADRMGWKEIHLAFHEVYGMGTATFLPKVGDYAILIKDVSGSSVGSFCIVTEADKATSLCTLEVLSDEIQEAWRQQNYIKLQELFYELVGTEDYSNGSAIVMAGKVSAITKAIDALTGLKANEHFVIAKPPKAEQALPHIGDFAFTLEDINDIKKGTYCQVVDFGTVSNTSPEYPVYPYVLSPLTEEAAEAFKDRNAKRLRELLLKGSILKKETIDADFPNQFVSIKPPNDQEMPDDNEAQPADMTKAPAVGDVIQIKRGPDKGKYGVIAAINPDFTFEYNEVSKEHALIILRGKM
jgi:hypothetical protein